MLKVSFKIKQSTIITYKYAFVICLFALILSVAFNVLYVQHPIYLINTSSKWQLAECTITHVQRRKNYYTATYEYKFNGMTYVSDKNSFWPGGTRYQIQVGNKLNGLMNPSDPSFCVLFPKWRPVWYYEYIFNGIVVLLLIMSITYYILYKFKSAQQGDAPEPASPAR